MKVKISILILFSMMTLISVKHHYNQELKLTFIDPCTNEVLNIEYDTTYFKGSDVITIHYYIVRNNMNSFMIQDEIPFDRTIDTILVPKILFLFGQKLHNPEQYYMNCNSICHGEEIEYYKIWRN